MKLNQENSILLWTVSLLIITSVSVSYLSVFNIGVIIIGIFSVFILFFFNSNNSVLFPKENILFAFFILWSFGGIINSVNIVTHIRGLFTLFQIFGLMIVVEYCSTSSKNVKKLLNSIVIGIFIVLLSVFVTGEYFIKKVTLERIGGFSSNANALSMISVTGVLILIFFIITRRGLPRFVLILILLFFSIMIIETSSRKGMICLLLVCLSWFILIFKRKIIHSPIKAFFALFLLVMFLSLIVYYTEGSKLEVRMGRMLNVIDTGSGDRSILLRFELLNEGLETIQTYPVFGVGIGNFKKHTSSDLYSHNNYIEVCANSGIPGLILYYSVFLVLFLRLKSLNKKKLNVFDRNFVSFSKIFLLLTLVADIGLVSYYNKLNWIMTAIIIGYSSTLRHKYSEI